MRNAIGGAWLYSMVMVFTVFLVAFVSITLNYANAYKMQNQMMSAIEANDGFNSSSLEQMQGVISTYSYRSTGNCESGYTDGDFIGVLNGNKGNKNVDGKYNYCISRIKSSSAGSNNYTKYYYNVTVFFGFDLPLFGNLYTFRVNGETNGIMYPCKDFFD